MRYIGNTPEQEIVHTWAERYDYVKSSSPPVDVNPSVLYVKWLNSSTGQEWVCIDNTLGANVWIHLTPTPRSSRGILVTGAMTGTAWESVGVDSIVFGSDVDPVTNAVVVPEGFNRMSVSTTVQLDSTIETFTLSLKHYDSLGGVIADYGTITAPDLSWNVLTATGIATACAFGDYVKPAIYNVNGFTIWSGSINCLFWRE